MVRDLLAPGGAGVLPSSIGRPGMKRWRWAAAGAIVVAAVALVTVRVVGSDRSGSTSPPDIPAQLPGGLELRSIQRFGDDAVPILRAIYSTPDEERFAQVTMTIGHEPPAPSVAVGVSAPVDQHAFGRQATGSWTVSSVAVGLETVDNDQILNLISHRPKSSVTALTRRADSMTPVSPHAQDQQALAAPTADDALTQFLATSGVQVARTINAAGQPSVCVGRGDPLAPGFVGGCSDLIGSAATTSVYSESVTPTDDVTGFSGQQFVVVSTRSNVASVKVGGIPLTRAATTDQIGARVFVGLLPKGAPTNLDTTAGA